MWHVWFRIETSTTKLIEIEVISLKYSTEISWRAQIDIKPYVLC